MRIKVLKMFIVQKNNDIIEFQTLQMLFVTSSKESTNIAYQFDSIYTDTNLIVSKDSSKYMLYVLISKMQIEYFKVLKFNEIIDAGHIY